MSLTRKFLSLILSFLLVSFTNSIKAESQPKNNIYLEMGGNAGIYSLNYERFFAENWGLRLGVGALWTAHHLSAPLMVNRYWGNPHSSHKLEIGLGLTYFDAGSLNKYLDRHENFLGTATFGYRYIPKKQGLSFKIAFTPFIGDDFLFPWIGFSVGLAS